MMGVGVQGIAGEDLEVGDVVCWNEKGLLVKMKSADEKDQCAGVAPSRIMRLSKFEPALQLDLGHPNEAEVV